MEDGDNPDERKEYTIEVELREVNRGAFGTVHIGKCAGTGREFALKRPIFVEQGATATNDDATRVRLVRLLCHVSAHPDQHRYSFSVSSERLRYGLR